MQVIILSISDNACYCIAVTIDKRNQVLHLTGFRGGSGIGHGVFHDDITNDRVRMEFQLASPFEFDRSTIGQEEDGIDGIDIVKAVSLLLGVNGNTGDRDTAFFATDAVHRSFGGDEGATGCSSFQSAQINVLSEIILVSNDSQMNACSIGLQVHVNQTALFAFHAGSRGCSKFTCLNLCRNREHTGNRVQLGLVAGNQANAQKRNQ